MDETNTDIDLFQRTAAREKVAERPRPSPSMSEISAVQRAATRTSAVPRFGSGAPLTGRGKGTTPTSTGGRPRDSLAPLRVDMDDLDDDEPVLPSALKTTTTTAPTTRTHRFQVGSDSTQGDDIGSVGSEPPDVDEVDDWPDEGLGHDVSGDDDEEMNSLTSHHGSDTAPPQMSFSERLRQRLMSGGDPSQHDAGAAASGRGSARVPPPPCPPSPPVPSFSAAAAASSSSSPYAVPPRQLSAAEENDDGDIAIVKRAALLKLDMGIRYHGWKCRHEYTMDDSVRDIQFEIEAHEFNEQMQDNVKMMQDGLTLACNGLQIGNDFLGPLAKLHNADGSSWAEICTTDITAGKYDRSLEQIYRQWFKRGGNNPYLHIAFGLGSSMARCHFANWMNGVEQPSRRKSSSQQQAQQKTWQPEAQSSAAAPPMSFSYGPSGARPGTTAHDGPAMTGASGAGQYQAPQASGINSSPFFERQQQSTNNTGATIPPPRRSVFSSMPPPPAPEAPTAAPDGSQNAGQGAPTALSASSAQPDSIPPNPLGALFGGGGMGGGEGGPGGNLDFGAIMRMAGPAMSMMQRMGGTEAMMNMMSGGVGGGATGGGMPGMAARNQSGNPLASLGSFGDANA